MVFSKVGGSGLPAIAAISASCSANARSNAGPKCSGLISPNGGTPNGVVQVLKNGLSPPDPVAVVAVLSLMGTMW